MLEPRPSGPVATRSPDPDDVKIDLTVTLKEVSEEVNPGHDEDEQDNQDNQDEDEEPEKHKTTGPNEAAQRKRTRQENFNAWAAGKQIELAASDKRVVLQAMSNHQLSTSNLIRKQEFASEITTPREYQLELFERAKKQNTIAVLDTGSGKTLIAVLLLRHVIDEELTRRGEGKPPRISFFLVDSVALVFQQYAVLDNNIDQAIGHFCGAMGTDLWSKDVWINHFKKNMVIVCTAEVLRGCLFHAYITINQINLLIFDEAHHAKKNHPYAKIIEDFYTCTDRSNRPRVFGMTASPVDAKVDVVKAATELEYLLDSKIATTSDMSLLRKSISRPNEVDWVYYPQPGFKTPLYYALEAQVGKMNIFKDLFRFADYATENLGPWAADRVWQYGLKEEESERIQQKTERSLLNDKGPAFGTAQVHTVPEERGQTRDSMSWIDAQLRKIRKAQDIVAQFPSEPLEATSTHLSPKVARLHRELCRYFERKTNTKCIVFVGRRHTARILCDIFQRIGTPFLKPGVLIGVRQAGDMNVSYRTQVLTLINFRNGYLNCLFATSVAEEGLDIPDCNLVIRFDLYGTVIQYIQSRGRARHKDSTFVHMIENGNDKQGGLRAAVHDTERTLQAFCQSLPEDRCLDVKSGNNNRMPQRGLYDQSLEITSTGAKLTPSSSLAVLAHFAACLNYDETASSQLNYSVRAQDRMYHAEVFLPETHLCPVKSAVGMPATSKAKAKQSAAMNACRQLIKLKLFDEHLNPTFQKRVHTMHNAHLAIHGKKTDKYPMRVKPRIWSNTWGEIPRELYVVVIDLKPTQTLNKPYPPIAFLTRTPMPSFPTFPVYLDNDVESAVVSTNVSTPLNLTETLMAELVAFTFRIFEDCFNKIYERDPSKMSYWLAPVRSDWRSQPSIRPMNVVDRPLLSRIANDDGIKYPNDVSADLVRERLLIDPNSGRYRYFPIRVDSNLKADSSSEHMPNRRNHTKTILPYSLTLWGFTRSKFLETANHSQPVWKAEIVPLRRNLLDRMSEVEKDMCMVYDLCLQPLKISSLTIGIAATAFVFPAILTRFESYLVAQEACDILGLKIRPALALEAVTKDSDNAEGHRGQQIQYQRGMGKNYERLEFLGDCFLKMATSIAVYVRRPGLTEQWYHDYRMVLICNRNLFATAKERKIFEFIRSRSFERAAFYPEGLKKVEGTEKTQKTHTTTAEHALGEKTIADVCEALIGAAVLSPEKSPGSTLEAYKRGGKFDMAVKAVTALVNNKLSEKESDHANITCWADYYKLYALPEYQTAPAAGTQLDLAQQIADKLGYKFRYPRLLRSAFLHPSYGYFSEKIPSYQRLEFLGDSLLDMACVIFLYERHPHRDPQWLTEHKMAMVSNKFFGAVAVKLGFHKHLRHNTTMLLGQIQEYVAELAQAEESAGGAMDYWMVTKDPPKCLPDTVEAYIGAMFVDSEFDYGQVERFFEAHIRPYFEDMNLYDTYANKHPTVQLEKLMVENFGCRDWYVPTKTLESIDGTEPQNVSAVMVHGNAVGAGQASAARNAKVKACAAAIAKLKSMHPFEFREQYGCDCKPEEVGATEQPEDLGPAAEGLDGGGPSNDASLTPNTA